MKGMRVGRRYGVWLCGVWGELSIGTMPNGESVVIIDGDSFAKLLKQNERLKRKVKRLEAEGKLDREYLLARD